MNHVIAKAGNSLRTHRDLSVGIGAVVFGGTLYALCNTITGTEDFSGSPWFFPQFAAAVIAGLGLLLIILNLVLRRKNIIPVSGQLQWKGFFYALGTMAIMIVSVLLMKWLGFIITSMIAMAGLMVLYGARQWLWIALLSVGLPVGLYFLGWKVILILFPTGKIFS